MYRKRDDTSKGRKMKLTSRVVEQTPVNRCGNMVDLMRMEDYCTYSKTNTEAIIAMIRSREVENDLVNESLQEFLGFSSRLTFMMTSLFKRGTVTSLSRYGEGVVSPRIFFTILCRP